MATVAPGAPQIYPELAQHSVSREWIETHYVWAVREAFWGETKPARLSVGILGLNSLAKFKGLVIDKQVKLNVPLGSMSRDDVRKYAESLLDQLQPGARNQMRELLAREDATVEELLAGATERQAEPVTLTTTNSALPRKASR